MPQRLDRNRFHPNQGLVGSCQDVLPPGPTIENCKASSHHPVCRAHVRVNRRIADMLDHLIFPDGLASVKGAR